MSVPSHQQTTEPKSSSLILRLPLELMVLSKSKDRSWNGRDEERRKVMYVYSRLHNSSSDQWMSDPDSDSYNAKLQNATALKRKRERTRYRLVYQTRTSFCAPLPHSMPAQIASSESLVFALSFIVCFVGQISQPSLFSLS